ncbi:Haloacid dehalogenase-like hydrolase-domain-containing protein [Schizothecium vesticola]|uniref:Haloacid dehalogenase-like hydrolase-domain-containing protein n=1 Tax=Schizothecium vesticola TaxID=314040 RepID=A0AA40EUT3_9PEZI|nr:Haloacid dehalogenase-like hydrolase-domain-containing protein [Schizothecium vesticola]
MPPQPLTPFTTLSFDCFGTLIDWESGLLTSLSPLLSSLPPSHPWTLTPLLAVQAFNAHSEHLWRTSPTLSYPSNLSQSLLLLAAEAAVPLTPDVQKAADDIATAPGRWPAFEDSVAALKVLKRYFKLVILSNVDEGNISRVVGPGGALDGVRFDAVYTAERIESYKPNHGNFEYLFAGVERELGGTREGVLHVARSLTADHVPAKELGLRSGYGTGGDYGALKGEGRLGFEWMYQTLGEFAEAVEREFEGRRE